jgi:2-keto-4-pentenoate hydratase/2-oxohepta-3-ene-1,7-dioic acid hydratase in catechol pathway
MKIARVQLSDGSETHATPSGDGWAACDGGLERGWVSTGRRVEPVRFLSPVSPAAIFVVGQNYRAHVEEMGGEAPSFPVVAMKNPGAVIGNGDAIVLPGQLKSDSVDYEVELAVVIGRTCKNLRPEHALDVVAGYTVANDVSARDWQKIHTGGQWCKGKGFDTFCPLGPVLATPGDLPDPQALPLILKLNGEEMQRSSTADMLFSVRELLVFLSADTTLAAGTVILTGTPPGVGAARIPPRYLRPGDVVEATIEGIGTLTNPVREAPSS